MAASFWVFCLFFFFVAEWENRGEKSLKVLPVLNVHNVFDGHMKHMLLRKISQYLVIFKSMGKKKKRKQRKKEKKKKDSALTSMYTGWTIRRFKIFCPSTHDCVTWTKQGKETSLVFDQSQIFWAWKCKSSTAVELLGQEKTNSKRPQENAFSPGWRVLMICWVKIASVLQASSWMLHFYVHFSTFLLF